jgi:hypothetical protein
LRQGGIKPFLNTEIDCCILNFRAQGDAGKIGPAMLGDQNIAEIFAAGGNVAARQTTLALQFMNQQTDGTTGTGPLPFLTGVLQAIETLKQIARRKK